MRELTWLEVARVMGGALLLALACIPRWRVVRIVGACAGATTLYALLQDQWSANFSPEYFSIGHPRLPGVNAPPLLGLVWGVLAGFPPGIILGLPIAMAATLGAAPPLAVRDLRAPLLLAMLGSGVVTAITALSAAINLRYVNPPLSPGWSALLAPERRYPFAVVAHAHSASYAAAGLSGLLLLVWVLWQRRQRRRAAGSPAA